MCRHWCHAFGFAKDAYCEQNCFLPCFRATWLHFVFLTLIPSSPNTTIPIIRKMNLQSFKSADNKSNSSLWNFQILSVLLHGFFHEYNQMTSKYWLHICDLLWVEVIFRRWSLIFEWVFTQNHWVYLSEKTVGNFIHCSPNSLSLTYKEY